MNGLKSDELLQIIEKLAQEIEDCRNIYATIFISYQGISINVYPYDENESQEE